MMSDQAEKARHFRSLHVPGRPLVLYNIWDAGSAKVVAAAGAPALATGSWSVAAAQGYEDGEALPLPLLETIIGRVAATVDLPLSVDFEGGYAADPVGLAANAARIIAAGAVGVNFEDRRVGGQGLYPVAEQAARIAALRRAADAAGIPLFINARTDLFLEQPDRAQHAGLIDAAVERAAAYREAGADGFFVPALVAPDLIGQLCDRACLPVNVMVMNDTPPFPDLAGLGVARISHGPRPYRTMARRLEDDCRSAMAQLPPG
jgi:2-methylisocitrate lyase-like PEP mutase family enzyme